MKAHLQETRRCVFDTVSCSCVHDFTETEPEVHPVEVTYILSILSAAEARKSVISKRVAKTAIFKLSSDEPWDTLKAQLLVKIDHALHPSLIQYDHYDIKFSIPRVFSKPGLSLDHATDYNLIVKGRNKDFAVNVTVVQLGSDDDKENEAEMELAKDKSQKKSVRVSFLPL
jgi:hypothetical protein